MTATSQGAARLSVPARRGLDLDPEYARLRARGTARADRHALRRRGVAGHPLRRRQDRARRPALQQSRHGRRRTCRGRADHPARPVHPRAWTRRSTAGCASWSPRRSPGGASRRCARASRQIVDDLLDDMIAAGPPADLAASLSWPLPITVICEMLGVPAEDQGRFRDLDRPLLSLTATGPRNEIEQAREGLNGYLAELIAARRAEPTDDLLGRAGRRPRQRRPPQRGRSWSRSASTLLVAGHETTANQTGNFVFLLLRRPELWEQPGRRPRTWCPAAVEELLRFVPLGAAAGFARIAKEDVELARPPGRAGEAVMVHEPSANRDATVFDAPTRSTSTAPTTRTSRSATACTTASAPSWPGWNCRSPSAPWCVGSRPCASPCRPKKSRGRPTAWFAAYARSPSPGEEMHTMTETTGGGSPSTRAPASARRSASAPRPNRLRARRRQARPGRRRVIDPDDDGDRRRRILPDGGDPGRRDRHRQGARTGGVSRRDRVRVAMLDHPDPASRGAKTEIDTYAHRTCPKTADRHHGWHLRPDPSRPPGRRERGAVPVRTRRGRVRAHRPAVAEDRPGRSAPPRTAT